MMWWEKMMISYALSVEARKMLDEVECCDHASEAKRRWPAIAADIMKHVRPSKDELAVGETMWHGWWKECDEFNHLRELHDEFERSLGGSILSVEVELYERHNEDHETEMLEAREAQDYDTEGW